MITIYILQSRRCGGVINIIKEDHINFLYNKLPKMKVMKIEDFGKKKN